METKKTIPADKLKQIVPEQIFGNTTEVVESLTFASREEAVDQFKKSKQRLLNVNHWNHICDGLTATFQLMDATGKTIRDSPAEAELIRIDLPAPGPEEGSGYDWVRIEKIVDQQDETSDEDFFAFRVRPVSCPHSSEYEPTHIFTEDATSCFMVYRSGVHVFACQIGNNELPNTDTHNVKDKIRNWVVALGAMAGFSEKQWKNLMKGVLYKC